MLTINSLGSDILPTNSPSTNLSQETAKTNDATASSSSVSYYSPTLKIDPTAHMAVLEYLDTKTGTVLNQFPSKQQIDAYQKQPGKDGS